MGASPSPPRLPLQHCHLGVGLSFLTPSGSRGSLGSQGCTKSPLSGLETIVLPFMETWAVSHNQAFRGWIKGYGSACMVLGIMELSSAWLTSCPEPLIRPVLSPLKTHFLPWAGPVGTSEWKGVGGDGGGQGGSPAPLLPPPPAPGAQFTALASTALGVNVRRGTTW